ncbi:hypothetical protein DPMN_130511 [Dreissena polymorpha]|uniref:Uncharacterized protein n=1 Tax=Dreissena polymorpha TaxID=45954 RepID=A0A9D4JYG2_DREPO|nr:hypothetical protein DPMN_130511 [Dreissena polymorpha]
MSVVANYGPLVGEALNEGVVNRSLKVICERGVSIVGVINMIKSLDVKAEDVDSVAAGPPGASRYDVVFKTADKLSAFLIRLKSDKVVFKLHKYVLSPMVARSLHFVFTGCQFL